MRNEKARVKHKHVRPPLGAVAPTGDRDGAAAHASLAVGLSEYAAGARIAPLLLVAHLAAAACASACRRGGGGGGGGGGGEGGAAARAYRMRVRRLLLAQAIFILYIYIFISSLYIKPILISCISPGAAGRRGAARHLPAPAGLSRYSWL